VAKEIDEGAVGFLGYQTSLSSRMGEKVGGSSMETVTAEKGISTYEEHSIRKMEGWSGASTLKHTMIGRLCGAECHGMRV